MAGIRKKISASVITGLIVFALPASVSFTFFSRVASAASATTLTSLDTPSSVAMTVVEIST